MTVSIRQKGLWEKGKKWSKGRNKKATGRERNVRGMKARASWGARGRVC